MKKHAFLMLLVLASVAREASASVAFPDAVQAEWELENLGVSGPGCLLCHTSDTGGVLTVQRPFGRTVRDEYEVRGGNTSALRAALRDMRENASDSDGDGAADYDELRNGTDVNAADEPDPGSSGAGGADTTGPPANEVPRTEPTLQTGCRFAKRGRGEASWLLALGALVSYALRRGLTVQRGAARATP